MPFVWNAGAGTKTRGRCERLARLLSYFAERANIELRRDLAQKRRSIVRTPRRARVPLAVASMCLC